MTPLQPLGRVRRLTDVVQCPRDHSQVLWVGRLGHLPQLVRGEAVRLPVRRHAGVGDLGDVAGDRLGRPVGGDRLDVGELAARDESDDADAVVLVGQFGHHRGRRAVLMHLVEARLQRLHRRVVLGHIEERPWRRDHAGVGERLGDRGEVVAVLHPDDHDGVAGSGIVGEGRLLVPPHHDPADDGPRDQHEHHQRDDAGPDPALVPAALGHLSPLALGATGQLRGRLDHRRRVGRSTAVRRGSPGQRLPQLSHIDLALVVLGVRVEQSEMIGHQTVPPA